MKTKFEFYTDAQGLHRWTKTSGKEVYHAQQGFNSEDEAIDNARRNGHELPVEDIIEELPAEEIPIVEPKPAKPKSTKPKLAKLKLARIKTNPVAEK